MPCQPDAPRILICRLSAMGDTILTLPVACALRRRFPNAYLGWVVETKSAEVVQRHDCLDAVFVLNRGWFTSPREVLETRRMLRPSRFDIALDPQGLTKSALAGWLSGARTRIGYGGKHGCELSPLWNNRLVEPQSTHLVDRSLELLRPLGIDRPEVAWRYPIRDLSRRRATEVVRTLPLKRGYAVVNPGASWDSKLWEMRRFGDVARHLGQRHGIGTLVIWGNERERDWAREIVATSAGCGVVAPRLPLEDLAAILERAVMFVSGDTGPMHLAVAVGTRCIGLHGVTRPQDSGPYGEGQTAIQVRYRAGTRRQRRRADNREMRLITSEQVCAHCDQIIDSRRRSPAA